MGDSLSYLDNLLMGTEQARIQDFEMGGEVL